MGCTASKLDNEDTVRRCKERRRLMKEAVYSRHHLAFAHADYLRSLRLTGSALTSFAKGETLFVSEHTPPILLSSTSYPPSSYADASSLPPSTPHPPPPPPPFSPSVAVSAKVPHIPSEPATPASTSFHKPSRFSNYATTPSQASSVWDWENLYPPSPPDSEYFDRRQREREEQQQQQHQQNLHQHHHLPREEDGDEEEEDEEREEVPCSEWGGAHSSNSPSSSTISDDDEEEEAISRSERIPARSDFGGSSSMDAPGRRAPSEIGSSAAAAAAAAAGKSGRRGWSEAGSSRWSARDDGASSVRELRMVVRHRNLAEIVAALEEYFVKEAVAGESVSELLETGRAQFEKSFRQLKKTVYHSNSVLSSLSSSWTSKPPLAIRYKLDTGALEESGGAKSHASTLERLLAWEKKLYEEVKAREGVKIEHEKKLSTLQSQEYKGRDDAKVDKTKASIKKLQSLIIVTSQAVSTTSSAIIEVRDNELAQQLVEICIGHMNMWRLVNQFHEVQYQIVQQVRGLVNRVSSGESTSDLHRLATRDLEASVSSWHSSFNHLIKYQRDYVRALYGWLKLTHFPVSSNSSQKDHSSAVSVELTAFCDEWKQALDRLPDTVASEAIKSFVNIIHGISTKQTEELKIKKRAATYSKELEKKTSALRALEKKFYQSYSMVGLGLPDGGHDSNGQVFDTRDPLADKKSEIAVYRRKVEDEMMKHAKAVEVTRSMTLNNIQTALPGVFQAMTGFSGVFAEALQGVCRRAGSGC